MQTGIIQTFCLALWARDAHDAAVAAGTSLTSGMNLFSMDLLSLPSEHVPINRRKVQLIQDTHLSRPTRRMPGGVPTTVALNMGENPIVRFGKLKVVSPIEPLHAVVFQIASDIVAGRLEAADIKTWRHLLLCCPVTLVRVDNAQSTYSSIINEREGLSTLGDAIKRTNLDRGWEVMETKALLDGGNRDTSVEETAQWYVTNIRLNPSAEPVHQAFITSVFSVWKRFMGVAECADAVAMVIATDHAGSPLWNSMYKLLELVKKGGTPRGIHWCVAGVHGLVNQKIYLPSEVSIRVLSGKGMPNGRGLLDLLLYALELAEGLVAHAQRNQYESAMVTVLERWLRGYDVYASDLAKDATFIGTLKPSSQAFLKLFEDRMLFNSVCVYHWFCFCAH